MTRLATIVLAAGGSRRMGEAQKLLAPVAGEPMVTHAVRAAVDAGLGPVLVVTGDRAAEVEAVLPDGVAVVHNPAWGSGMASSLRSGLAALPADRDAVLVALGDMPLVRADQHRTVADAWRPGRIVVPMHAGSPGHPVALAADFLPALASLDGDRGARGVVLAHPDAVIELPMNDPAVVTDVDDPAALARVQDSLGRDRSDHPLSNSEEAP